MEHILVVDADPDVRQTAIDALSGVGCRVLAFGDAEAALAAVSPGWPHLLLLEYGPTVRDTASARREGTWIALIDDDASLIDALEDGAEDGLRKPLDPALMAVRVRAALRRASRGSPVGAERRGRPLTGALGAGGALPLLKFCEDNRLTGRLTSEAEAQRVLEERARALARPLEDTTSRGEMLERLVFTRAGESFAIDAGAIVEVLRRAVPIPLPGTRGFLSGVIHHRGRVLGVVDVRELIVPGTPASAEGYAIVITNGLLAFAIFADEVQGLASLADAAVRPPDSAARSKTAPWIRGTTADMVTVIDLAGLARDARISVNEPGA